MPDPAQERQQYFDQYAVPLPPNQGFNDPAWQKQNEQEMIDIYRRAQTVKQAEADVSSARRMLGIIKADREVQQGKPIDRAMYDNIHYFVNPGDKNFSGAMQQLRPVPPPYATNFPGMTAPVVIAPTRSGQTVHFPPASVLPQTSTASAPTEYKTPTGKHLAWGIPGAKGGVHVLPEPVEELKPAQQANVLTKALTDIGNQLRDVETGSVEESTLKAQQQEYRDMLRGVAKGTSKKIATPPVVGTILKGHRFIGGDPSKSSSWEKAE